jgi:threonine dehydrogenase-like Zn-dependent dehydrogenase
MFDRFANAHGRYFRYMAAENCDIKKGMLLVRYVVADSYSSRQGDTVAVWGCGPVGQFAIRSALLLGAGQVIAIDRIPERLRMAAAAGARTIDLSEDGDLLDKLKLLTSGRGPDCCIDAVGLEAKHGATGIDLVEKAKQVLKLQTDRPAAIQEILRCVRKGGRVSIPGAYLGTIDHFPLGMAFNKGVTIKTGCTHMQRYWPKLVKLIESKAIDPAFVISHRMKLDEAAMGYDMFRAKTHNCIKIVLVP